MFHHDFHDRLEELKDAYAPFDPDPDTRTLHEPDADERADAHRRLVAGLRDLLEDANFEEISDDELARAFEEESLVDLHLEIDRSDFTEVLFFHRGETTREREVSSWFGLRRRVVTFVNDEKVLVLVTFRDEEHFTARDVDLDELPFTPGSTIVKLFQDVPRADLEILFPNATPRMRRTDKLLIGIPALVSGIVVFATKLATSLGLLVLLLGFWLGLRDEPVELDQATLVTLGAGMASLGGYLTRQFTKFRSRRLEFLQTLSESLYFRNLDNDAGVFHHLLDDAEEEEVKESLLAWWFLRTAGRPLDADELDEAIEGWFASRWDCELDFEVDDGLAKLRRLGLVADRDGGRCEAVPLAEALERLDARWDAYFTHHRPLVGD